MVAKNTTSEAPALAAAGSVPEADPVVVNRALAAAGLMAQLVRRARGWVVLKRAVQVEGLRVVEVVVEKRAEAAVAGDLSLAGVVGEVQTMAEVVVVAGRQKGEVAEAAAALPLVVVAEVVSLKGAEAAGARSTVVGAAVANGTRWRGPWG